MRYGGGLVSLFEFARWLIFLNLISFILLWVFVLVPQFGYSVKISANLVNGDIRDNDISEYKKVANETAQILSLYTNSTVLNETFYTLYAKRCGLQYQIYLKEDQPTVLDYFLDIIKGTVSKIFINIRNYML